MAIVKAVSSKASIKTAIEYVTKEEKTEEKLVSGINCSPENAYEEMQTTKEMWGKTGGRTYKHFVQSYHPDDPITPEQAHQNALVLAKQTKAFEGFEVLVTTHVDKDHIHSHIIVNSVNIEDGHKLQWSKSDLARMKELSNKQSKEQRLHVAEKGKTFTGKEREKTSAYTKEAYWIQKKAESGEVQSYVQDIAIKVLQAREVATNKEDFIQKLDRMGVVTDWQESHKYITFTDKEREASGEKKCKARNSTLEKYYNIDFSKEGLIHEFKNNRARASHPKDAEPGLAERIEKTKAEMRPANDRIDRIEKKLKEIREDRERASEFATGPGRSGSGRSGITPEREPETESRDREPERTDPNIKVQPFNRSGMDAEIERVRANLRTEEGRSAERDRLLEERSRERETAGREFSKEFVDATIGMAGVGENQQRNLQKQRNIDREHRSLENKNNGINTDCRRIDREQQHIIGEQRGIKERITEFADKIKETVQKIFTRGKGR